jgi:hypothetical protein
MKLRKEWRVGYNTKTSSYTFANLKDKQKTKKNFVFSRYFCNISINNHSIAVYKKDDEIALVHMIDQSFTKNEPVFFKKDEYRKFIDSEIFENQTGSEIIDLVTALEKLFNF